MLNFANRILMKFVLVHLCIDINFFEPFQSIHVINIEISNFRYY